MNILEKIIAHKEEEVKLRKQAVPEMALEKMPLFNRPVLSMKKSLLYKNGVGVIAEFKRQSPSKGIINASADVSAVTRGYHDGGAAAISVLTDTAFFGGSTEDLSLARENQLPILRKDFMIDEYQVLEAKAMGADVILLIAACLTPQRVKQLAAFARSLQLEVLLELHGENETDHICDEVTMVGINNRDLKTFSVNLDRSIAMAEKLKRDKILIAESGINDAETILLLQRHGFSGFLVGEYFMKQQDPAAAFRNFMYRLNQLRHEN